MPYYGMLLVQQALAGGADMLDRGEAGECTAFVLKGRAADDLRVLVVNKAQKGDCAVDLKLTAEQAAQYADTATVDYLYAGGCQAPARPFHSQPPGVPSSRTQPRLTERTARVRQLAPGPAAGLAPPE